MTPGARYVIHSMTWYDRGRRQPAERQPRERRARVEPAGRVELQLRIAGPPAVVPRPRRGPVADHVPEARELPGMIVERERPDAERPRAERDAEGEQQSERNPGRRAITLEAIGRSAAH